MAIIQRPLRAGRIAWRILKTGFFVVAGFVFLFFAPESPNHTVTKGIVDAAYADMPSCGGGGGGGSCGGSCGGGGDGPGCSGDCAGCSCVIGDCASGRGNCAANCDSCNCGDASDFP